MPRPCWNFWGPYWPISRVSDHLRAAGPARPGPRSLRVTPPSLCQSRRSGSRPWGMWASAICVHRGIARISSSSSLPLLILHTMPSRVLSPPPFLISSSSFLSPCPRNVGENPRRLARIFLGLYYYCRGSSTQMVSSTGRFVRSAKRGFIFPSFLLLLRHHHHLLLLLSLLLLLFASSYFSFVVAVADDLRLAHSFCVRWTFFVGTAKRRQFPTGNLGTTFEFQSSLFNLLFRKYIYV